MNSKKIKSDKMTLLDSESNKNLTDETKLEQVQSEEMKSTDCPIKVIPYEKLDNEEFSYDLTDNTPISPADAHKYGVIISVPTMYISTDESICIDRVTLNLRAIKYNTLVDLVKIAMDIGNGNKDEQLEISSKLANRLAHNETSDYAQFIELIKWASSVAKELDVEEVYCDASNVGLSFDLIRQFVCDPETGVLQSAEPITFENYQLYSQLGDNNDEIQRIRVATNDSDFNRMQYYIAHFEKQLTLAPGYVPNQTTKLINIALFFMTVFSQSHPISGFSSNDLKGNILSYTIDVLVRSRVIQAWQRDQNTKILLKDLTANYDNRNLLTKISTIPTARERAQTFLNLVKGKPELAHILDIDFYNRYMDMLEKYRISVANEQYYLLGSEFILALGAILPNNILEIQNLTFI